MTGLSRNLVPQMGKRRAISIDFGRNASELLGMVPRRLPAMRSAELNLNPAVNLGPPLNFVARDNQGESSGLSWAPRRVEWTALQIALEGFAEDATPALHRVQLRRSLPQLRGEAGDPQGSAGRTKKLHQLKISATMPASGRQRFRSCVVKPPRPHWFFSSSKVFSQSPRSRYDWLSVRICSSSEVTNPAYSHTSRSGSDRGEQRCSG